MNKVMSQMPSVDQVLKQVDDLLQDYNHGYVVERVRRVIEALREQVRESAELLQRAELLVEAERKVRRCIELEASPNLRRVVNATGVILHTGLGRAPLPAAVSGWSSPRRPRLSRAAGSPHAAWAYGLMSRPRR